MFEPRLVQFHEVQLGIELQDRSRRGGQALGQQDELARHGEVVVADHIRDFGEDGVMVHRWTEVREVDYSITRRDDGGPADGVDLVSPYRNPFV